MVSVQKTSLSIRFKPSLLAKWEKKGCWHISKKSIFDTIATEKDNLTPKNEKEEEIKVKESCESKEVVFQHPLL